MARAPSGMVRPDPLSHFENHIERDGVTLGCFLDSGQLVGYGVLGIDSPMARHLAALLGADAARFALLDGAAVLDEWRGSGVHQGAIEQRIAHAATAGRSLIGATVSPHNLRAMHSMFRAGFTIDACGLLYGGLERLLVRRDTLAPGPRFEPVVTVEAMNYPGHRAALADHLTGYAMQRDAGANWSVSYGRPL
jgi:GNAT superfamily N-acetyltransferase